MYQNKISPLLILKSTKNMSCKLLIDVPVPINSKVYYIVTTFRKSGDLSSKYYNIIQGKATWANMPRVIREWGKTCFGDLETAKKVKEQLKNT